MQDLDLDEIKKNYALSVRSYNVCLHNDLLTILKIINYFLEHGDFLNLWSCGVKSSMELETICTDYLDSSNVGPGFRIFETEDGTKDEESTRIYEYLVNFNEAQNIILESKIRALLKKLTVNAKKSLSFVLHNDFSNANIFVKLNSGSIKKFKLSWLRDVDEKIIEELRLLKQNISEHIREISCLDNEESQNIEIYIGKILQAFPNLDYNLIKDKIITKDREKLIALVEYVISSGFSIDLEFQPVFDNCYNFYFGKGEILKNVDLVKLTRFSENHMRKIKSLYFEEIEKAIKLVYSFKIDFEQDYGISFQEDLILLSEELIERIHARENILLKRGGLACIIMNYISDTHTIMQINSKLPFNATYYGGNIQHFIYIVKKELFEDFDFYRFHQSLQLRYNLNYTSRKLNIDLEQIVQKHMRNKNSGYQKRLFQVCQEIIFQRFGTLVDNKGSENVFIVQPKTRKFAVVYEILEEHKKPLRVEEIHTLLKQKSPDYDIALSSLRSMAINSDKIICFGRTSTYGLKAWEKEMPNIKGGSIRSIIKGFLTQHDKPMHITDITEYVCRYRNTNKKSIEASIFLDDKNNFVRCGNGHYGLSTKCYDVQPVKTNLTQHYLNQWEELMNELQEFVKDNKRLPKFRLKGQESRVYRFYVKVMNKYNNGILSHDRAVRFQEIEAILKG